MSEVVSYCHKAKIEPHWVQDGWGNRVKEDICLKCWKPCDTINTAFLVEDESKGDSV